ncbi:MAG: hypothetical protein PHF81_02775 [Flavobacterium sp.]|nr:hypothetical protein [Flavobacterium sp.]
MDIRTIGLLIVVLYLFDDAICTNFDAIYNIPGRTNIYSIALTNVNMDPTPVGSTAPNVNVMPITKPRRHSARKIGKYRANGNSPSIM